MHTQHSTENGSLVRRLMWSFLWIVPVVISVDFLLTVYGKYHQQNPEAYAMFWERRGWLFTHLAGGVLTIVLGPIQMLLQRRITHLSVHRWLGRLYFLGMLVASLGAVGLITTSPAPDEIRGAFAATTLVWLVTGSVAWRAIRRKRVLVHRRWMIRNYLVTLAPIVFRLFLGLAVAAGVAPSPRFIAALLLSSWCVPLLAYEILAPRQNVDKNVPNAA